MDDFRDIIVDLEARIEVLAESIERCRKLSLAAKLLIGGGAGWIVLVFVGLVPFVPYLVIGALAAAIGGVVLLGSNATTWTQADAALHKAEATRAELIGRMEMQIVEERPTLH